MQKQVTIVGGGIAGLTTAIALNKIGLNPSIFEAAPTIKAIGAGLGLAANAMKAFKWLDIQPEVIQCGRLLPCFTIYDQRGKPITTTQSKSLSQKFAIDNFTIHRAALYKLLISKIDKEAISTNKRAVDIEQRENTVVVKFQDGSLHETDCLIIADGIHSQIRQKLIPNAGPRYAGYTCWRAVVDQTALNLQESSETWGRKGRFGIVPLAGDKLYWFACINAPQNDSSRQSFTVADLAYHFKDFHHPIPAILNHTKNEELIWNDILDLKPLEKYVFHNIVLIGDAAHATTPNMGQGACQAIEDAVVLAQEIKNNINFKTALQHYETRRLKRTHYITNTSWKMGKIAQLENPALALLRNYLLRLLPNSWNEKQLEKLYEVDF